MGTFIQNTKTADVQDAAKVSLSGLPNFQIFKSKESGKGKKVNFELRVVANSFIPSGDKGYESVLRITDVSAKEPYEFKATNNPEQVNSSTFFVHSKSYITAENLKVCLMSNKFIASNFKVTVKISNNVPQDIVCIESLGAGSMYDVEVISFNPDLLVSSLGVDGSYSSLSKDSIDVDGTNSVNIELDIYTDNNLFIGEQFDSVTHNETGRYMTTISKAYYGQPLWFDLNSTFRNSVAYSDQFLTATEWCDAGTAKDYRFIAYTTDGVNKAPFYMSDVFHVLKGYGRNLDIHKANEGAFTYHMEKYLFNKNATEKDATLIEPLTTQPILTHVLGQAQYFNFISTKKEKESYDLNLIYELYTQSMQPILVNDNACIRHMQNRHNFSTVSTIRLDIDHYLEAYPNVGVVKVYLGRGLQAISNPQVYNVLPSMLHNVKSFAFLNSLGGWSSYGFVDNTEVDFSTSGETIFKTHTPDYQIYSQIESVTNKEVTEKFTVQTMPIHPQVADWLKEMSTSEAVYELDTKTNQNHRYVVLEEMKLKHTEQDGLVRVSMKYKYSDSFNGRI